MKELLRSFTMAAILLLCPVSVTAQAPQGNAEPQAASRGRRTIPLSADQVQNGRVVYDADCASCHGPSLSDGLAPSLTSRAFRARWTGQSAAELRDYIRQQMPPGQAGTLTNEQNTNLVALLLNDSREIRLPCGAVMIQFAPVGISLPSGNSILYSSICRLS